MPKEFKLTGTAVVNTRTGEVVPNCSVLIRDGVIRDVSAVSGTKNNSSADGPELNVAGTFLVPGFNDMHAHALQDPQPELSLAAMLAHGITGVRQLAGSPKLLADRQQGRFSGMVDAPEVLEISGEILTRHNAATPEMATNEVKRQASQGADFIKVIDVDNATFFYALAESQRQKLPFLGHVPPQVDAAEASRKGMRSIEHLGPAEIELISCSKREWLIRLLLKLRPRPAVDLSPEKMVEIGRLIVANPTLFRAKMDPDAFVKIARLIASFSEKKCRKLARTFKANATWQCPTLIRLETMQLADSERFAEAPELRFVPSSVRAFWKQVSEQFRALMNDDTRATLHDLMELELRMTKIFDEEGVRMITGSDYGGGWVVPGVSLHQEFDLLERAGLTPLKILQMTTLLPAIFLEREQTMGTVEVGKQANLVLLGSNPAESVAALHDIRGVIRNGVLYTVAQLAELKDHVAQTAKNA